MTRLADRRKLMAVVYLDMVGYSRLIGMDDTGTLERLRVLRRNLIDPAIEAHGGRIVQTGGDSLLMVFDSIDGAVRCAISIQQQVPVWDGGQPPDRAIRFRIGISIGDAIADGSDLHGDVVNIAVRLQSECPSGGICVTRPVRDHMRRWTALVFDEQGHLNLKNIEHPVEAFALRLGDIVDRAAMQEPRRSGARLRSTTRLVGRARKSAAPSQRAGSIEHDGPGFPELALIPAGSYLRGVSQEESRREGADDSDARPVRRVTIPAPFWLSRYPVTRGEFAAFVVDTGRIMPNRAWTFEPDAEGRWRHLERMGLSWRNPGFEQTDRHPVVCVSHTDAIAYTEWLTRKTSKPYRLPTEAEWEYAARAGSQTARYWGDGTGKTCRYANVGDRVRMSVIPQKVDPSRFFPCDDGYAFTSPVGSFLPNAFGLYDMLGNVWEWTADAWHASYDGAPDDGTAWMTGGAVERIVRGGSWNCNPPYIRVGVRNGVPRGNHDIRVGFRIARC